MASKTKEAREKAGESARKAKDKAEGFLAGTIRVIGAGAAILMAGVLFFGGLIPFLGELVFSGASMVLAGLSGFLGAAAAWMRKSSNEPHERAAWVVVSILLITFAVFLVSVAQSGGL